MTAHISSKLLTATPAQHTERAFLLNTLANIQRETAKLAHSQQPSNLFLLGKVYWQLGHIREAQACYQALVNVEQPSENMPTGGVREYLRALLLWSEGHVEAAIDAARAALASVEHLRSTCHFADSRVLLARLLLHIGRPDEALHIFAPALSEHAAFGKPHALCCEGEHVIAPLLRLAIARGLHASFAADALALFVEAPPETNMPSQQFSPCEIEVLRLLAQGASNQRIGEQLAISQTAVQAHVAVLLGKLGVASRGTAANQARALGLL